MCPCKYRRCRVSPHSFSLLCTNTYLLLFGFENNKLWFPTGLDCIKHGVVLQRKMQRMKSVIRKWAKCVYKSPEQKEGCWVSSTNPHWPHFKTGTANTNTVSLHASFGLTPAAATSPSFDICENVSTEHDGQLSTVSLLPETVTEQVKHCGGTESNIILLVVEPPHAELVTISTAHAKQTTHRFRGQEGAAQRSEGEVCRCWWSKLKVRWKNRGQAWWEGEGSPTLLCHLYPEPGPAPSLSWVDGSGSESVKSLRRRETHVHLLKQRGNL